MTHCGGGAGATDVWNSGAEIEKWLDTSTAPEQIEAVKRVDGRVARKRPLCAYPHYAAYKGSGDIEDAASFECRLP